MKIQHLRNATTLITFGKHCLLVDPMFSDPGALPGFKLFGGGRRANPLVPLPEETDSSLTHVTDVLITHEHPDHIDIPAIEWIKDHRIPVWASSIDAPNLRKKLPNVREVKDGAFGASIEILAAQHGRGMLGWFMGPVSGYYLAYPDEPSLYIISDAILTDDLLSSVDRLHPDIIIAPAGAANIGIGSDILFSVNELVTLIKRTSGEVILNHLEAIDHCPTTRDGLRQRMAVQRLGARVHIPEDGEQMHFERPATSPSTPPEVDVSANRLPGFQKWLTAKFTMT